MPWQDCVYKPINFSPMRKKYKKTGSERPSGGFDPLASNTEFYSSSPTEKPLSDTSRTSMAHSVRKTGRHQGAAGRRPEKMDPREKLALMAILKSVILILLLVIAFFMLWKGIKLYEESIWLENADTERSPVMQEVVMVEDFDIQDENARELFVARIQQWKDAERLVRSADALLKRSIYDQAIEQCQNALRQDPAHSGALERLGELYYAKQDYVEAVNAYIRLLSVDPARGDIQKRLIQALDAFGDHDAVRYMAEWYLDQNLYDVDIQRYLAKALSAQGNFEEAAEAYGRVLREAPKDIDTLEQQASNYMQVGQYEKALVPLNKLRENNYRDQTYYKQIAICNAQLEQGKETVETLGRAAQLFGEKTVMGWMQDPLLDPVREDRLFQAFTDRIGGEEFRRWLEKMAQNIDAAQTAKPEEVPKLQMPGATEQQLRDNELLKPRQ